MPFQKVTTRASPIRLFTSGTLILVEYVEPATVEAFDEVFVHQLNIGKSKGQLSMVMVASAVASKIEDDVKKKAAEVTKALEKYSVGTALIIPGNSLTSMMVRTVVTGINMVTRSASPTKCYATVQEGLSWLQSLPKQDAATKLITAAEIEALCSPAATKKAA